MWSLFEKFELKEILVFIKNYRLFFLRNKRFWMETNQQSALFLIKQFAFFCLLTLALFLLVVSGSDWKMAAQVVFNDFSYQPVIFLFILYFSNLVVKRHRKQKVTIIKETFWFIAFTTIILYPIKLVLTITFFDYEAFLVLWVLNVLTLGTYIYVFIYSAFLFTNKIFIRIIIIVTNLILLNIFSLLINSILLNTSKASVDADHSLIDPISNEYFKVLKESKVWMNMPFQRIIIKHDWGQEDEIIYAPFEQVKETYFKEKLYLPLIRPSQNVETQMMLIPALKYGDSLELFRSYNDSLSKRSIYQFSKAALNIRDRHYLQLKSLTCGPIGQSLNHIKPKEVAIIKNEDKSLDTVTFYEISKQAGEIIHNKDLQLSRYTERINLAYKPAKLITTIFYYPAHIINKKTSLIEYFKL